MQGVKKYKTKSSKVTYRLSSRALSKKTSRCPCTKSCTKPSWRCTDVGVPNKPPGFWPNSEPVVCCCCWPNREGVVVPPNKLPGKWAAKILSTRTHNNIGDRSHLHTNHKGPTCQELIHDLCSIKQPRVLLPLPGWDASLSQGWLNYEQIFFRTNSANIN